MKHREAFVFRLTLPYPRQRRTQIEHGSSAARRDQCGDGHQPFAHTGRGISRHIVGTMFERYRDGRKDASGDWPNRETGTFSADRRR